ncbi:hypothetical protein SpCBS45565_g07334 [Spizellomyces sp. 'palustris']|nr:hypothetical protein SpCBS45565_g07334 [Spizellomyces sp. 'palustris']
MLEQLETFLYHESDTLIGNQQLMEECIEWSSLFPHLRVRGHQILPTKDLGYEIIPRSELRCHSPYFFVPENPIEHNSASLYSPKPCHASYPDSLPFVEAIGLSNDIVARKFMLEAVDQIYDHAKESTGSNGNWPYYARSLFNWSDPKAQEAIRGLLNFDRRNGSTRWLIFRYFKTPHGQEGKVGTGEEEEDRCPTPTPENPNPQPSCLPMECSPISDTTYRVELFANGPGGVDALKKHLSNHLRDLQDDRYFALLSFRVESCASTCKNTVADWAIAFIGLQKLIDHPGSCASELELNVTRISTPPLDTAPLQTAHIMNVYDVLMMLPDLNSVALYEYLVPSFEDLLRIPAESVMSSLTLIDDGATPCVNHNHEEVFAENGEVDEWFACDTQTAEDLEDKKIKRYSHQRQAIPPMTPNASIRQDIVGHIFDDIWSELVPMFHPLIDALSATLRGSEADAHDNVHATSGQGGLGYPEMLFQDDSDDEGLLSAITIRPVSLQKRESSARVRSTHDIFVTPANSLLILEASSTSRPASARPTSARTTVSARPTSARPTSGRIADVFNHSQHQSHAVRLQSAAPKPGGHNWKRNNPGMRLLPLPAVPGPSTVNAIPTALNDTIYGTRESSRPSTSVTGNPHLSKRLPPIRSIGPNSHEVLDTVAPPKSTRHVLFETPDVADIQAQRTRATSPRPFSARRQPSAGLRRHRPHTAMLDDSRSIANAAPSNRTAAKYIPRNFFSHAAAIASLTEDHHIVMGTRVARRGVKSAISRRKTATNV